jgi:putative copper resistance protein D
VIVLLVVAWLTLPLMQSFADDGAAAPAPYAESSHQHPATKPIEKILYSEYNHHMSGVGLLLLGLTAIGMELGLAHRPDLKAVQWLWPAGWMILGTFLFIRSDPDNWPWGPIGFVETFTDSETLQHKIFSLVVLAIGVIEGLQIGRRSNGHDWSLVFPALGIGAGLLLGVHSFVHAHVPHVFWQHLAFATVGILIGVTKLLRDRAILGTGYRPLMWPSLVIVFAVQLILYTER